MPTFHFERWKHAIPITGPFRVYKQYYEELNSDYWANVAAFKTLYSMMGKAGLKWDTPLSEALVLPKNKYNFTDFRGWAKSYDTFQVWVRLNTLVSLTSILETYIDTVASLAIESNPGLLINADRSLDGVSLLKTKRIDQAIIEHRRSDLTKGIWPKRISSFDSLFMGHPDELDTYLQDLEELRNSRNMVGHAFGRDIAQSRKHEEVKALPLTGIREDRLLRFFDITYKVAKAIDEYLLDNHIGEYQALFAYHVFKNQNKTKRWNTKQWADKFRDKYTTSPLGKQFFIDLVEYYENA